MGVSTNGILVFGTPIDEESDSLSFLKEFDNDFDTFVDSLSGLPRWGEKNHDWNKTHNFRNNYPIDLTLHCSLDYPMYILSIRGTQTTAYRGYVEIIDPNDLVVSKDKIDKLKVFCDEYGIEWQEPKWYLVSMWG